MKSTEPTENVVNNFEKNYLKNSIWFELNSFENDVAGRNWLLASAWWLPTRGRTSAPGRDGDVIGCRCPRTRVTWPRPPGRLRFTPSGAATATAAAAVWLADRSGHVTFTCCLIWLTNEIWWKLRWLEIREKVRRRLMNRTNDEDVARITWPAPPIKCLQVIISLIKRTIEWFIGQNKQLNKQTFWQMEEI